MVIFSIKSLHVLKIYGIGSVILQQNLIRVRLEFAKTIYIHGFLAKCNWLNFCNWPRNMEKWVDWNKHVTGQHSFLPDHYLMAQLFLFPPLCVWSKWKGRQAEAGWRTLGSTWSLLCWSHDVCHHGRQGRTGNEAFWLRAPKRLP